MPCSNDNRSGQALFGRLTSKMKFLLLVKFITSLLFKFYLISFERPLLCIITKQLSKLTRMPVLVFFVLFLKREGLIQL